jgi:hypothetical protein
MTRTQEQRLYRSAVQASLEAFYGKSEQEATQLVRDWWKRLVSNDSLDSDLLLHSEPMNTAAGLAKARVIPITSENRDHYHQILNRSRDFALSQGKFSARHRDFNGSLDLKDSKTQRQIIHLAAASTSNGMKRPATRALGKKIKSKTTDEKHQVAFG